MSTIEVVDIVKTFGFTRAVDGVSFSVNPGEIFGLLGPNGAGKTTTIRILLDIFKADSGTVSILGGNMTEEKKDRIGYLPEERGLYQDLTVERCLIYLATLKGLSKSEASSRISTYLKRFELESSQHKKMKELSKGMQQKAQLIATLVHKPDVLIIDEPFSSLDPINTQMVKDLLREERDRGITIVMCTHQMHQVEELCDRIVLINNGKSMLYGSLQDIRHRFAGKDVRLQTSSALPAVFPGVDNYLNEENGAVLCKLSSGTTPQIFLRHLVESNMVIDKFEIAVPTLDDIFIQVVTGEGVRE